MGQWMVENCVADVANHQVRKMVILDIISSTCCAYQRFQIDDEKTYTPDP